LVPPKIYIWVSQEKKSSLFRITTQKKEETTHVKTMNGSTELIVELVEDTLKLRGDTGGGDIHTNSAPNRCF
jgi:hypothetical protein